MAQAPDVEEIRAQRQSSLLEKWGRGTRLSQGELAEIAPLIGEPEPIPDPAGEVEPRSTLSGSEPETDLLGDPIGDETGPTSKKGETTQAYERTLGQYAEIFDRSERVIKRWIATGRKNPHGVDLPPLDDPRSFPGWWKRNQRQRVPGDLMELAKKSPKKKEGGGGRAAPENNGDDAPPQVTVPDVEGSGFAAELERIKERTRIAASRLAQAEASRDELAIEVANKRYSEALKLLREFERDAQAILEKQGELIPRQALELAIREAHTAIRDRMRAGIETVRAQLKAAKTPEDEREVWDAWLDTVFRLLSETDFTPEPDSLAE